MFGFAPFGQTLQATLIMEYNIPAGSQADVLALGNAWHALRALPFPSEAYNAALPAVTERFTARNAAPGRTNGSAIGQMRTNDFFALSFSAWEFREFHLDATSGMLVPAPVAQTPDRSFNFSGQLGRFVLANEPVILAEKHAVPPSVRRRAVPGRQRRRLGLLHVAGAGRRARKPVIALRATPAMAATRSSETGGAEFQVRPRFPGQGRRCQGSLPARMWTTSRRV